MDDPRLLARDSSKGYVNHPSRAVFAEPEAIPEEVQQRLSDEARNRWSVMKAEEVARKASRSRCNRLKNVDIAARDNGVDIHRHLVAIERELGLAERLVWPP